jgi:hypothetical protein
LATLIANVAFTALASAGVSVGTATAISTVIGSIGATLLYTAAANALMSASRPDQPTLKSQLSVPTEKPAYRYVYGHDLAIGSPAPIRVRGEWMIGCWILNSRPSAFTNWTLYLDKREVALTGDPFDFTNGGGATGTTFPFIGADGSTEVLRVWFGKGDQTTVPYKIRTDYPWASGDDEELFKTTDVWEGRTIMWAMMLAGGDANRQERWPSTPPLVEVLADWSKVWDPRDVAQDEDDPDTWEYSNNHALVILDAARQNPVKPYLTDNLLMSSFEDAADIADESVALKAGGSEPRYTITGTVVWQAAEIEDQLMPLFIAGAARPIRVGGQLGIVPGAYMTPDYTLTELLGPGFTMVGTQEGDVPNRLRTSYTSPGRLFEDAELEPYAIPGALSDDGGVPLVQDLDLRFAGSPTQAQRVQKIEGAMLRRNRRLTGIAPPAAINLVAGANMTLALHAPFDAWDGVYRIESIQPAADLAGTDGVALRCPFVAVRWNDSIYDWDEDTDEIEITNEGFDGEISSIAKPIDGTATGGAGQIVVTFDLPSLGGFEQIEFWGADVDDVEDAELLKTKNAVAGATRSYTETGLGAAVTRYYFARSKNGGGRFSGFTASVSDTTDP